MQKDESIIKQILGSRIKVEKLYLLKHPGSGSIKIFTPKNELIALENEEKILEEELAAIKEEKSTLKTKK